MSRLFKFAALGCALLAAPAFAAGAFGSGKPATPPAVAAKINHTVPASLLSALTTASKLGLGLAPPANTTLYMKAINGPRVAKGDKVGVLYVGADYCPYCAGQRWALVLSLLRFGTFDNLEYMASSARDVYANTPTFSFQHAKYKSKYVTLTAVETADRDYHALQSMTKAQNDIFNTFDAPPHVPQFGSIPFVYIGGQYIVYLPMVSPNMLANMDWAQIAKTLGTPSSKLYQTSMPQINAFTAAICRLDGGNPDAVCSAPGVTAANAALFHLGAQSGH
ncbi:MAG: DUF929 family protein [Gammaproteobacteria bacterium]